MEYDLQTSCAEIIGVLFKTHKDSVAELVNSCKTKVIPAAMSSSVVKRYRFAIFILDDMVEHLGPTYFSPEDWQTIVNTICSYCDHTSASLRQASAYGIGILAQNSGEAFQGCSELCLTSLKKAIDVPVTEKVQGKKEKMIEYNHARDNAIASIGKILKHQSALVWQNAAMASQLVSYWISLLPITHDLEEAQAQYEFLCDFIREEKVFTDEGAVQTATQLATVFGESFQDKYFAKDSEQKAKQAAVLSYLVNEAPAPIQEAFKGACEKLAAEC